MLQPTLHNCRITLVAPTQAVTGSDGWIRSDAEGIYHADIRAVSQLSLATDAVINLVATQHEAADSLVQRFILRGVGETGRDPELVMTRTLHVSPGSVRDDLLFENFGSNKLSFEVAIRIASDLARIDSVKAGRATVEAEATVEDTSDGVVLVWSDSTVHVRAIVPALPRSGRRILLGPGESVTLTVTVDVTVTAEEIFLPATDPDRFVPDLDISVNGHGLQRAVKRSLEDLRSLLLVDAEAPQDAFLAAGAPWYLTLFGRDSLWAARFLLPLGTDLAMGTLRTLARRQATEFDARSQAEPGKILHEVRAEALDLGNGVVLPPVYYGSIDATALWVSLLHGAWRYGADEEQVQDLLPNLEAALAWLVSSTGPGGLLSYIDSSGRGLANQGWKDSADGIRHRDGAHAEPPIALCEVQAYAYAAARQGAELQKHFGVGDPDRWNDWATRLSDLFRASFWVDSPQGPHPAVALDGAMRPVSALTSNIGHLLGTGICNATESAQIAKLLVSPELNSGYGLRTMASDTGGYNPLGYHTGSVWAHDTMIAARGLAADGFLSEATELARGLLAASVSFQGRLPELYGGYPAEPDGEPTAYAASCRPQAWAAASTVEALRILLGFDPDVPHGTVRVATRADDLVRGLRLSGFRLGNSTCSLVVDDADQIQFNEAGLLRIVRD